MKQVFALFLFLGFATDLFSQKEFDKWIFGKGAGLDFTSGTATVMNTTSNGWDNSASIADSAGNLLFASDGQFIYDRNGSIMLNGSGIMGDTSGGACATIVKKPGSHSLYYVFTNPGYYNAPGLRYTVVDMSLNGGLGDVDTANKNVLIFAPYTEKIVPIIHGNGNDIWILVHEWNSNTYRAYLLTPAGLGASYVNSSVGTIINGNSDNAIGELTVNKTGTMVACAILNAGIIDVSDFDNMSGMVSNTISITGVSSVIGLEFSPDGSKLYASRLYTSTLLQYDVSVFNQSAISASAVGVGNIPSTYSTYAGGYLMSGPDGKVYVTVTFSHNIGVIDSPNLAGNACHYNGTEIDLGQNRVIAGMIDKIAVTPIKHAVAVNDINAEREIKVSASPNPFLSSTKITVSNVSTNYNFELIDATGKLIRRVSDINVDQFELHKENLAAGFYFYRVSVNTRQVSFGKLVVE